MKKPEPWNWNSHVKVCPDCEGTGAIHSHRRATINDPFPETECECGLGEHEPECEVCGFNTLVEGYDCFVCATIGELTTKALPKVSPENLVEAMSQALKLAQDEEKAEAEALLARSIAA